MVRTLRYVLGTRDCGISLKRGFFCTTAIILQGLGPLRGGTPLTQAADVRRHGADPCGVDCAIVAALYMRIMRTCACTGCVAGAVGGAGARAGAVVVVGLRARVRLLAPARLRLRVGVITTSIITIITTIIIIISTITTIINITIIIIIIIISTPAPAPVPVAMRVYANRELQSPAATGLINTSQQV